MGPLHLLPVPDTCGDSVAIDFIGPLAMDEGFDMIITFMDQLGADVHILLCHSTSLAEDITCIFFDNWYCDNGLPLDIASDCNKLFVSKFWKALHVLIGTKIKMSMAFHPETDSTSKQTNKTVNQMLQYHVEKNQSGWVHALSLVHFNIMNTINKSTGFSPFQLCMGHSPCVIPPLVEGDREEPGPKAERALTLIKKLKQISMEAQDNLLCTKISQAAWANKTYMLTFLYSLGGHVHLSTMNQ